MRAMGDDLGRARNRVSAALRTLADEMEAAGFRLGLTFDEEGARELWPLEWGQRATLDTGLRRHLEDYLGDYPPECVGLLLVEVRRQQAEPEEPPSPASSGGGGASYGEAFRQYASSGGGSFADVEWQSKSLGPMCDVDPETGEVTALPGPGQVVEVPRGTLEGPTLEERERMLRGMGEPDLALCHAVATVLRDQRAPGRFRRWRDQIERARQRAARWWSERRPDGPGRPKPE